MSALEPEHAPGAETELLLSALRSAVLCAKLDINEFVSIGIALRSGMITAECAIMWLQDAGLVSQVIDEARP